LNLRTSLRFSISNLKTLFKILKIGNLIGPENCLKVEEILNKFKYKYQEDLKFDSFVDELQSNDPVVREIQKRKLKEFEMFLRDSIKVAYELHR
jgi:hypothetical protein